MAKLSKGTSTHFLLKCIAALAAAAIAALAVALACSASSATIGFAAASSPAFLFIPFIAAIVFAVLAVPSFVFFRPSRSYAHRASFYEPRYTTPVYGRYPSRNTHSRFFNSGSSFERAWPQHQNRNYHGRGPAHGGNVHHGRGGAVHAQTSYPHPGANHHGHR